MKHIFPDPISVNYFKNYLEQIKIGVEYKIIDKIRRQLAIIFKDGWDFGNIHLDTVIATFARENWMGTVSSVGKLSNGSRRCL